MELLAGFSVERFAHDRMSCIYKSAGALGYEDAFVFVAAVLNRFFESLVDQGPQTFRPKIQRSHGEIGGRMISMYGKRPMRHACPLCYSFFSSFYEHVTALSLGSLRDVCVARPEGNSLIHFPGGFNVLIDRAAKSNCERPA